MRQRPGRFEQPNRGKLLLDEINAADLRVELRLLQVLQEREFERVDFRVIAVTNVDLREEVAQGTFRDDLYYRPTSYRWRWMCCRSIPLAGAMCAS